MILSTSMMLYKFRTFREAILLHQLLDYIYGSVVFFFTESLVKWRSNPDIEHPSRLSTLAEIIANQTAIIDKHLRDNRISGPTFDKDQSGFDQRFPPLIEEARSKLQEATLELHELTKGPRTLMQDLIFNDSTCFIDVIYRFQIAQKVPINNPYGISYNKLASGVGIDSSALQRILRLAIANHIFTEPTPSTIAHNANSTLILTDPNLHDWMGVASQDIIPMLKTLGPTLESFPSADEPTEAAGSSISTSVDDDDDDSPPDASSSSSSKRLTFYQSLSRNPPLARRFARGMAFHNRGEPYGVHHMVASFPWGSLPPGSTIVDVGGSHGEAAYAISAVFPHLKFVVQDLPEVIESAPPRKVPYFDDDGGKIEFMAHDFFYTQPVIGAEVYYLRWIFHNWPDKYCVRILRALIPALKPGSRVLVVDDVLPEFGTKGFMAERRLRMLDLVMMALGNAREREEGEFRGLFAQADERFRYVGLTLPEGSNVAAMEMVWDPCNDIP